MPSISIFLLAFILIKFSALALLFLFEIGDPGAPENKKRSS